MIHVQNSFVPSLLAEKMKKEMRKSLCPRLHKKLRVISLSTENL